MTILPPSTTPAANDDFAGALNVGETAPAEARLVEPVLAVIQPNPESIAAATIEHAPATAPAGAALPISGVPATSYLRLLVGGALEGGAFLRRQIQEYEAIQTTQPSSTTAKSTSVRARTTETQPMAVGLAFDTLDLMREGVTTASMLAVATASTGQRAIRPLYRSRLFDPLRSFAEGLAADTKARVERLRETGRAEEKRSRALARAVFERSVGEVTDYLGSSDHVDDLLQTKVGDVIPRLGALPAIETLIQDLVGRYIAFLQQNPDQIVVFVQQIADGYIAYLSEHPDLVDALIRQRGDRYLDYLHDDNPEVIQDLIQGQSLGLAGEIMDQVRERTVTADSLVETLTRAILRRTPRSDLPEPPDEIKNLAAPSPLPFRRPGAGEQS